MVIASSEDLSVVSRIIAGEMIGTLFKAHRSKDFHLIDYLENQ